MCKLIAMLHVSGVLNHRFTYTWVYTDKLVFRFVGLRKEESRGTADGTWESGGLQGNIMGLRVFNVWVLGNEKENENAPAGGIYRRYCGMCFPCPPNGQ